jgi:hypothetical protein
MLFYTITADYMATGEGRTIMVMITYAESELEAQEKFTERFGVFYTYGAEVKEGLDVDFPGSDMMLSAPLKQALKDWDCYKTYSAEFYYNFS